MKNSIFPAPTQTDLTSHIETLESEDETRAKLRKALAALGAPFRFDSSENSTSKRIAVAAYHRWPIG